MKRGVDTLHMGVSEASPLFGDSYDAELAKQKPNYDAPPYNKWPDGSYYKAFVDSGLVYDPDDLPFHVNELPQIRSSYNPEKIEALAERVKNGELKPPYIKLHQAVRIAEFTTPEALQSFMDDYQLFYDLPTPITIGHFDPEPNGNIRVLNYGHRRTRSVKVATKPFGYMVLNRDIKKEIIPNPTFEEFIDAQSKENESDRPGPEDEAAEIRRRFNFYKAKHNGEEPTKKWLAQKMGYGEDKIRDGLRFTDLSPRILDWFKNKIINYEIAVECWRLREAAIAYYPQRYPHKYEVGSGKLRADAEALVLAELTNFAKGHLQGVSYDQKLKVMKAKINSLNIETQPEALFDDSSWDDPEAQKRTGGRAMAKYAISVLEYRISDSDISDAELTALEGLSTHARQKQAERAAVLKAAQEAAEAAVSHQEEQQLFEIND